MPKESNYTGYHFVCCRRCQQLGLFIDRAMQPVIGETGAGEYILRCGHVQETGRAKPVEVQPIPNEGFVSKPWLW